MKKIVLVIIAVILIAAVTGVFAYNFMQNQNKKQLLKAPEFEAEDLDGNAVKLSEYEGKIVLLNFMFYEEGTCDHCKVACENMMRLLQDVRAKYSEDDVQIITINLPSDPNAGLLTEFIEEDNITLTIINDPFSGSHTKRAINETKIGSDYMKFIMTEEKGTKYIANPTLLVLDQEHLIQYKYQVSIFITGQQYIDNDQVDLETLSEVIDKGLEEDWPNEGILISPEVQLLGMFVLGIFISLTPCAFAIFVSMTSFVLATKSRKKPVEEELPETGLVQLSARPRENKLKQFLASDEVYGGAIGAMFTLGMSIVFFIMGTALALLGSIIRENAYIFKLFFIIAGLILIFVGINNIRSITLMIKELISKLKKPDPDAPPKESLFDKVKDNAMRITAKSVLLGAFLLGLLMSLGWAPCVLSYVMPVYIMVMTQEINFLLGGVYLFVMALGFGVPIILISTVSMSVKGELSQNLMGIGKIVKFIFSGFIILFGIYLIITTIFHELALSNLLGI